MDAGTGSAFAERLACVLSAQNAELRISFGTRGCFGGTDNELRLQVAGGDATLQGFTWATIDTRARVGGTEIPKATLANLVRETGEALTLPEVHGGCMSTGREFAHLSVRCDGSTFAETFTSASCSGLPGTEDTHEYLHAVALTRIAMGALDSFSRLESPLTPAESEAERRKWSGLYVDGYRVRHDPVEAWELDGGAP